MFPFRIWKCHFIPFWPVGFPLRDKLWVWFLYKLIDFFRCIFKYIFFMFNHVLWWRFVLVNAIGNSVLLLIFVSQFFLHVSEILCYYFIKYIFEPGFSFCTFKNSHNSYVCFFMISFSSWMFFIVLLCLFSNFLTLSLLLQEVSSNSEIFFFFCLPQSVVKAFHWIFHLLYCILHF